MLKEIFTSKKFWYAVAGVVVAVVAVLQPGWADQLQNVLYTIIALILGQGMADIGKATVEDSPASEE